MGKIVPFENGKIARPGWDWMFEEQLFVDPRFGQVFHVMYEDDGGDAKYDMMLRVERNPGCFIPLNPAGEIGLICQELRPQVRNIERHVKQFPYQSVRELTGNLGRTSWEIPRGYAIVGERGSATAVREAQEETGGAVTAMIELGHVCGNTSIEPHYLTVVAGYVDLSKRVAEGDPNERLIGGLTFFSWKEINRMMVKGEIYCAYTISAFALLDAHGKKKVLKKLAAA